MPDEVINETENLETEDQNLETEQIEEAPVEEISKETPKSSEEKRAGLMDRIGNFLSGKKETEDDEFKLPVDFANAWEAEAEKQSWTQEDLENLILEDGKVKYTDEELLEMIPFLSSETEEPDELENSSANEEETKRESTKEADEKFQAYEERIAALEKALEEGNKRTQEEEAKHLWDQVSESFDKSGIEAFGKTEQLPRFPDGRIIPSSPQYKARQEVWDIANVLMSAGWSMDESMKTAFNAYKGQNLEADVKRDVIKDIKSKSNKLSAKRTSHGASKTKHAYGPDVVGEALRKHGLDENG